MNLDKRALFPNSFLVLNQFHAIRSDLKACGTKASNKWNRKVCKIDPDLKVHLVSIVMYVATAAAGALDLLCAPYRLYRYPKIVEKSHQEDIARLAPDQNALHAKRAEPQQQSGRPRSAGGPVEVNSVSASNALPAGALLNEEAKRLEAMIRGYIQRKGLKFDQGQEEEQVRKALACYARSSYYFGRVAMLWVDYLLKKADREGKQIVFMARDGIAPYNLAGEMLKKYPERYPNLSKDGQPFVLAYLSRKIVDNCLDSETGVPTPEGRQMLQTYMRQRGVRNGNPCIYVDVGFEGSMTSKIKMTMETDNIDFEFLISIRDDRAHGFLATQEERLVSVPHPTCNLAIHWLEDTHQGTGESPTHLVVTDNGTIVPNTNPGKAGTQLAIGGKPLVKERCVDPQRNPGEYLLRKWGRKAVRQVVNKYHPDLITEEAKEEFDEMLAKIRRAEVPLFIGRRL